MPSSVWSHLTARSSDEAGLLVHHFLLVHLLCALVGSVISFANVVSDLQAQPGTHPLTPDPCLPQGEGQGFTEQVPPQWGGVEFLVWWFGEGTGSVD